MPGVRGKCGWPFHVKPKAKGGDKPSPSGSFPASTRLDPPWKSRSKQAVSFLGRALSLCGLGQLPRRDSLLAELGSTVQCDFEGKKKGKGSFNFKAGVAYVGTQRDRWEIVKWHRKGLTGRGRGGDPDENGFQCQPQKQGPHPTRGHVVLGRIKKNFSSSFSGSTGIPSLVGIQIWAPVGTQNPLPSIQSVYSAMGPEYPCFQTRERLGPQNRRDP